MTLTSVTGTVSCQNDIQASADGGGCVVSPIDIASFGGISGLFSSRPAVLVAVFTADTEAADPSPAIRSYRSNADFEAKSYAPLINQTFFVGDGLTGTGAGSAQKFIVPAGASKLWFGFMDGINYQGLPGAYDGNIGELEVSATLSKIIYPAPLLDAGAFIGVKDAKGVSELCTTAFGARDENGVIYTMGAKHCANGREGDQITNSKMAEHSPSKFRIYDPAKQKYGSTLAKRVVCEETTTATCRVPKPIKKHSGDIFSWKPRTFIPSARVQTGSRAQPLPVRGVRSPTELTDAEICHFGAGSSTTGKAERCGKILTGKQRKKVCRQFECQTGLAVTSMYGISGDSGGPVYTYNKRRTAVYAVGIVIGANDCKGKKGCLVYTTIYPIGDALSRLGLELQIEE